MGVYQRVMRSLLHWHPGWRVSCLFSVVLLSMAMVILQGCVGINRVHLIIPDAYQGFLVIRFRCPQGAQVQRAFGTTTIVFGADGSACLAESYGAVIGGTWMIAQVENARRTTTIPWVTDIATAQGWGLVDLPPSTPSDANGQVLAYFATYWVGDMGYLRDITADQRFTEWKADFFAEHMGFQRDGSFRDPHITPTPYP